MTFLSPERCEVVIRNSLRVENAAALYALAIRHNAKDLEEYSFRFSLNHMTAVVQSDGFQQLDDSIAKAFVSKAAKNGAFKS